VFLFCFATLLTFLMFYVLGRIAIYSSVYGFSGSLQAYGGTGPSTSSFGAAGTIFIQSIRGSSIYKQLIVDNGGQLTTVGQYTAFTIRGTSAYSFDMVVLSGRALLDLKPDAATPSVPISATFGDMRGDLTGTLKLFANSNLTLRSQTASDYMYLDTVVNKFETGPSNSVQLAQSTEVTASHANITTVNVAVSANSVLILPSLLYVCNVSFTGLGKLQNLITIVYCPNYASPSTFGIVGCKTPGFSNYNPLANLSGPCINYLRVPGCMNPAARNYNASATTDNGSCIYNVPGCTIPSASNYNPLATIDDGRCVVLPSSNITCPPPLNQTCSTNSPCVDNSTWSATGVSPCTPCTSCSDSGLGIQLSICTKYRDTSCLFQVPCTPGISWSPTGRLLLLSKLLLLLSLFFVSVLSVVIVVYRNYRIHRFQYFSR
jgi:hypothetical protein